MYPSILPEIYNLQVNIAKNFVRGGIKQERRRTIEDIHDIPIHITQGWYEVEVIAESEKDAYQKAKEKLKQYKIERLKCQCNFTPEQLLYSIKVLEGKENKNKNDKDILYYLKKTANLYLGIEYCWDEEVVNKEANKAFASIFSEISEKEVIKCKQKNTI